LHRRFPYLFSDGWIIPMTSFDRGLANLRRYPHLQHTCMLQHAVSVSDTDYVQLPRVNSYIFYKAMQLSNNIEYAGRRICQWRRNNAGFKSAFVGRCLMAPRATNTLTGLICVGPRATHFSLLCILVHGLYGAAGNTYIYCQMHTV
jgi:hypothetical protein